MALDFPNAPSPGDVFDNWEWDGTKWIPAPGGGGGATPPFGPTDMTATTGVNETFVLQDQPTVNQPTIMGVTDGSNAVPGAVGEYVETLSSVTVTANGSAPALSLNFSVDGGDWDLWWEYIFTSSEAKNGYVDAVMNKTYADGLFTNTVTLRFPITSGNGAITVGPWRSIEAIGTYNLTALSAQYTVNVTPFTTSATLSVTMRQRRVR